MPDKFEDIFEIDSKIDSEDIRIHPMIIQPFVENAIKHGLLNKSDKGVLKISFKLTKDEYEYPLNQFKSISNISSIYQTFFSFPVRYKSLNIVF